MKKDQNLPNKNILGHNSSEKPFPENYKNYKQQSPHRNNFRGRSLDKRNHKSIPKTDIADQIVITTSVEKNIQDQTQKEAFT